MKKIALTISVVCLGAISQAPTLVRAADLDVTTCVPSDLRASISADATSERILLSQEPGGQEKPYSQKGSYIVVKLDEPVPPDTEINISETDRKTRISQEIVAVMAATQALAGGERSGRHASPA